MVNISHLEGNNRCVAMSWRMGSNFSNVEFFCFLQSSAHVLKLQFAHLFCNFCDCLSFKAKNFLKQKCSFVSILWEFPIYGNFSLCVNCKTYPTWKLFKYFCGKIMLVGKHKFLKIRVSKVEVTQKATCGRTRIFFQSLSF